MKEPGFETLCAHAGEDPFRFAGGPAPPIFQNSLFYSPDAETFARRGAMHPDIYDYTRVANPTTDILEAKLAALEHTEAARCFGSGMAAIAAIVMNCTKAGDHVVAIETVYGPTRTLLKTYMARYDVSVTFVPGTETQQFADAIRPNTRLIFLESPSTFVFLLQNLTEIAQLARDRGITTVIDNSWASPYFQNPTDFGIDLVAHSATKYLGGHSDIVAGAVMGKAEKVNPIREWEGTLLGGILDPFASWLMVRGLRTLPVRMDRHQQNALQCARFLENRPRVARVNYPGLPSHPQYALGQKQMRGYSGLLSFEMKDGSQEQAFCFANRLRYFGIACSWGGYESLVSPIGFPASAENGGKPGWGARLHIGLETAEDLLKDLDQALRF